MERMYDYHLLEWTYTPPDFFEEPLEVAAAACTIKIADGRIEARIKPDEYPADHSLRDALQKRLQAVFQGTQVLSHRSFSLTQSNLTSVEADGRTHRRMFAECGSYLVIGESADVVVCDSAGNVIRDTKAERLAKRRNLATLAAKWSANSPVVSAILNSYTAAVNDPANELVYLYEVRDALAAHFGGKDSACGKTGVSSARWSRLGQLSNDEPLRQGRHRGQQVGALRDAMEAELAEAREIARDLVEGLLRHFEGTIPAA